MLKYTPIKIIRKRSFISIKYTVIRCKTFKWERVTMFLVLAFITLKKFESLIIIQPHLMLDLSIFVFHTYTVHSYKQWGSHPDNLVPLFPSITIFHFFRNRLFSQSVNCEYLHSGNKSQGRLRYCL